MFPRRTSHATALVDRRPSWRPPQDSAIVCGADVDEIAKLCADLVVAGFIEPMTRH